VLESGDLYALYILSFVQVVVTTVLVLSPARTFDSRFRWTGSRVTEVLVGTLFAAAISAFSCLLAVALWGLSVEGAATAACVLVAFAIVGIVARPDCSAVGKIFSASFGAAGFTFLAYAALVAANAARSVGEALVVSLFLMLNFAAFLLWYSSIGYVSDVLSRTRHSRPLPDADPHHLPFVSVHIPAYNEPPELLIETIKAVEAQDYRDFEIVVMDNNTSDPAVWGPVEEYCRGRERVKFVHVEPWPGYKAGACNLALRSYTDPRAEIIALVDADDIVQPHYLKEAVPYFSDERLGFVQTFEGNRDYEGSGYYTACVDSYQGFYLGVMSSRNERDTVPFVGTMGLFRRSALEGIGGWNEWCISEDTEASLRVLKAGWSGVYIPRCFGRGIVPPTFGGLNTQRHRWCFGAMQILRLHWRSLMPWDRSPDNHLTSSQRRDYLMASLSWFRDLLMLCFAMSLVVTTVLLETTTDFTLMPLGGASTLLPMSLIAIATICLTWTLRHWTGISRRRALKGLVISLSATWITALACVQGLTHREGVFLRTSKVGSDRHPLRRALRLSRVETVLAVILYIAAGVLIASDDRPFLLILTLLVQATVYLCSPIAAFWNVRTQRVPAGEHRARFAQDRVRQANRRHKPAFASFGFALALLLALVSGALVAMYVSPRETVPVPAATVGPVDVIRGDGS
jgi:cellulose synthase/poly-beta-1,6-N-acetylglucosamine synthase-like glycosyltransferase